MGKAEELLKKYWGHNGFRPFQLEAIEAVVASRDALVLMPTGGGKSLIYQIPGLMMPGVCIVVTPLIALMKDQVEGLKRRGIPAVAIHSGLSMRQIDIALDNCVFGDIKFLYVSPERLSSEIFRMRASAMKVSLIAVDEAHCISQWGYDFRPSYLKIAQLRKIVPKASILALTASATQRVREDIKEKLMMENAVTLSSSFLRPNLSYSVRLTEDKQSQLLRIINNVPGSGIVYVRTRDATAKVAQMLREHGITAEYYHGGLAQGQRAISQDLWMDGRSRIMVATSAFGMGIDKADVRIVVHYDICDSPEEYYQQAGRAGRDGAKAYAVLMSAPDDHTRAMRRFAIEYPTIEAIKECYEALFNYLQVGIGDGKYASFEFNLFEFSSRHKIFSATALSALKILEQNGYLQLTEPADMPARIMFAVSRDDLYRIRIQREELDHILRIILRLYNGVFNGFVAIDPSHIASVSGYTLPKVKELLSRLWNLRVIRYTPAGNSPLLIMQEERLPTKDVYISPQSYNLRKENSQQRLQAIFDYSQNMTQCRSSLLQEYFGQNDEAQCGVCDICLTKKNRTVSTESLAKDIISLLQTQQLSVKQIVGHFSVAANLVVGEIDKMVSQGIICVGEDGKVGING